MTEAVMSAYDMFESDAKAEKAGTWIGLGTMRFKIARAGGANSDFIKLASQRFKPYQAAINADTMPKEIADDLVVGIFVDTIVLDWENVYGRDKQLIPFSKEACRKLLTDLPNLFTELQQASMKVSNFQKENLEAAAGN